MNQNYFFEGPEKKLELIFKEKTENFLEKPDIFWSQLVDLAGAKILSTIQSDMCKAFLLSESSLFIWRHRIILITCGTTTLIRAAEHLISVFGKNSLKEVFYERKNEYQPSLQKTSTLDDMNNLKEILGGSVLRFGRKDDHHVYIFNNYFSENKNEVKVNTLEVLMYGLQKEFKNCCTKSSETQKKILNSLKEILPEFIFDSYFFEPEGFSFNALKGGRYATMHVTPQGFENYLSFELDQVNLKEAEKIMKSLIELCKPISYDIIFFSEGRENIGMCSNQYELKQISKVETESGYNILYSHFYDKHNTYIEPFLI